MWKIIQKTVLFINLVLFCENQTYGQDFMKLLPIDEKDEVRLCYIDKRSPNLFDDLPSIRLTGDTLQQIVGMLQGIEQYEVHASEPFSPKHCLWIKKRNGTEGFIPFTKRIVGREEDCSIEYKKYRIKKEYRGIIKQLFKKVQENYKPRYAIYSNLPMCSFVTTNPSCLFCSFRGRFVVFLVQTDSHTISQLSYYVHVSKHGKVKVWRNGGRFVAHLSQNPEESKTSLENILRRDHKELFFRENAEASNVFLPAFPTWNEMSDKEKMEALDSCCTR